jgi:hypothetical protein
MLHAHHGHHGELLPFADVQRHNLDAVLARVELPGFLAHLMRQPAPSRQLDAQAHFAPVPAEDGRVSPGVVIASTFLDLDVCDEYVEYV